MRSQIGTSHVASRQSLLQGRQSRGLEAALYPLHSLAGLKLTGCIDYVNAHTGIVQQEPVLFATSIYENIAFGMLSDELVAAAPDPERPIPVTVVIEAAKKANAHDFIMAFPDGYDTLVGTSNAIRRPYGLQWWRFIRRGFTVAQCRCSRMHLPWHADE